MPEWLAALAEQGTPREVAGNTPLWLDAPQSVWLIRAGRIDVFAVPTVPVGVPVARRHLFRVSVGCLLCGVVGRGTGSPTPACRRRTGERGCASAPRADSQV